MYAGSLARAVAGDVENGSVMAGQVAALVAERGTAAGVIQEMVREAEATLLHGEEARTALHALGTQGEGGQHAAAVGDAAGADDGDGHRSNGFARRWPGPAR